MDIVIRNGSSTKRIPKHSTHKTSLRPPCDSRGRRRGRTSSLYVPILPPSISFFPVLTHILTDWAWKHDYTYLFHTVIEQAFRGSKGTTYSQILALDQKLRNHPVPKILEWPTNQEEVMKRLRGMDVGMAMQCYHRMVLQESSMCSFLFSLILTRSWILILTFFT